MHKFELFFSLKPEAKANNVPSEEAGPVEEVEMEDSSNAHEAGQTPEIEESSVEEMMGESHSDVIAFLKSKHRRCILTPNLARDHLRLVRIKCNLRFALA